MGRWAYFAPLWFGPLLVLGLNDAIRQTVPKWEQSAQWLLVAAIAAAAAVQGQVLMVGAQGAFAQVLPVPVGRSIRGGAAVAAGWGLVGWVVLTVVTAILSYEGVTLAAMVIGAIGLAMLLAAGVVYAWNLPTAVRDFGSAP